MVEHFGDPETNHEEQSEWPHQENALGREEYIGSYQQPTQPSPFELHHPAASQPPPPIYEGAEQEFDLEYSFPPHTYYMPAHDSSYHVPIPTANNFRVEKQRERGLRRRISRPNLNASAFPPHMISSLQYAQDIKHEGAPHTPGPTPTQAQAPPPPPPQAPQAPPQVPPLPSRKPSRGKKDVGGLQGGGPVTRNKFSLEEDTKILQLRFDHQLSWALISDHFLPHRSEKSLQVHYSVSLKNQMPEWTRDWSADEDQRLMSLVSEHQRAMWQVISKRFSTPGTAMTAIYSRFLHLLRKEQDEMAARVDSLKGRISE